MKFLVVILALAFARLSYAQTDSLIVGNAHSYEGLTIFLLSAPDKIHHNYISLEQALTSHRAVIHENNSQTLEIDNLSDSDLFIQSTDLIKGGQQDRMIAYDMIVPAHSSSHDLQVYCIEQGRSTKRGQEPIETFRSSIEAAPLPHMRVVAKHELTGMLLSPNLGGLTAPDPEIQKLFESLNGIPQANSNDNAAQESVWRDVLNIQNGLTRTLHDTVTNNESATSLQLALEHSSVQAKRARFVRKLEEIVDDEPRSVGFAYAINGELRGAEIYGSHALFLSMWQKLLKAASTEAILKEPAPIKAVIADSVYAFLATAGHGKSAKKQINDRTVVETYKSDSVYTFISRDTKQEGADLHESIAKE
jgi:hypothetical protein